MKKIFTALFLVLVLNLFQSSFSQTSDYLTNYISEVEASIRKNWTPEIRVTKSNIQVLIWILKDGSLRSVKVIKSSGDNDFDNKIVEAIKASAPFKPIPEQYKKPSLLIESNFDFSLTENRTSDNEVVPTMPLSKWAKDCETQFFKDINNVNCIKRVKLAEGKTPGSVDENSNYKITVVVLFDNKGQIKEVSADNIIGFDEEEVKSIVEFVEKGGVNFSCAPSDISKFKEYELNFMIDINNRIDDKIKTYNSNYVKIPYEWFNVKKEQ